MMIRLTDTSLGTLLVTRLLILTIINIMKLRSNRTCWIVESESNFRKYPRVQGSVSSGAGVERISIGSSDDETVINGGSGKTNLCS